MPSWPVKPQSKLPHNMCRQPSRQRLGADPGSGKGRQLWGASQDEHTGQPGGAITRGERKSQFPMARATVLVGL